MPKEGTEPGGAEVSTYHLPVGSREVVRALHDLEPDVVAYLPGFPLNEVVRVLEEDDHPFEVVPVASEFDAVGIVIGLAQSGGYGVAVLKDKGVYVAAQLLAEEGDWPGLLIVGLDADGRGSYTCSVELPDVLRDLKLRVEIPETQDEIREVVLKAAEFSREEHRLACVILTEDLLLSSHPPADSPNVEPTGEADWDEFLRAVDFYDTAAVVVGKGVLGDVSGDLPAFTSSLGDERYALNDLLEILDDAGLDVNLYCTKHASKFLPGVPPTGVNTGNVIEEDLLILVGTSYDTFAVDFRSDFVVSVNPDPDAYAHRIADARFVMRLSDFVRELGRRLR
ncbi:hypothetical protein [Methanopyrus sp.]